MIEDDIHSRSRLAGYKPEVLFNARVLVVGAGALGQNLALNLALAGIGELNIVDFDVFEPHNATRSPLYPNTQERELWGLEKAKIAAYKLLPMMTAPAPKIGYAVASIQSLGDLPIAHAQIVFAAVDNAEARAYLAERCHVVGRPLIEAGFRAEIFNLTIFGPEADDPCYRCFYPEEVGVYSCTPYALQLEQAHVIPAIQNTAAVLAGLQAEAGILWLHDERTLRNKRIYGNIRTMSMNASDLMYSQECPGIHRQYVSQSPIVIPVKEDEPLERLLEFVKEEIGPARIRFPEYLVMRNACTKCGKVTDAHAPKSRWLADPLCKNCGGSFSRAFEGRYISSRTSVHTDEDDEVVRLTCSQVGLRAGTIVEVWPDTPCATSELGKWYLMQMSGTINQLMTEL